MSAEPVPGPPQQRPASREPDSTRHRIPAGHGVALPLREGQIVRVVNTSGTQVVDTWAFGPDDGEFLSLEHTRELLQRAAFGVGDRLVSNRYRPLLHVLEDTSPGDHDTLIAPCSREMYARMGAPADHRSCTDNLHEALAAVGRRTATVPSPWNLFMRVPIAADGTLEFLRPEPWPGGAVTLRAEADLVLVCSACPDDLYPTNGGDGRPQDAHLELMASGRRTGPHFRPSGGRAVSSMFCGTPTTGSGSS